MNKEMKLTKFVIKENQKLKKKIKMIEDILKEMNNFKDILKVEEVCEELGIVRKTFERYRKEGLKVQQPKMNGTIYIRRSELDKFLNSKKSW